MVICFNCPKDIRGLLDELVNSGTYRDYSDVLVSAVRNLKILEMEVGGKGALVVTPSLGPRPSKADAQDMQVKSGVEIPRIFQIAGLPESASSVAEMPTDEWTSGQEISLDRWIFGQYNRLLPAKVSCRALAHLSAKHPEGVPLRQAAARIAEEAALLCNTLKRHDETNLLDRDDALSTAFPDITSEWSRANALRRYANQFVASVSKGKLSGLLFDLKLINYSAEGELRILLTEPGRQFALMPNPVLEGFHEHPRQKFSTEEANYLLDHIAQNLPVERFAYRAILIALAEGAYTPEKLDSVLQKRYLPASVPGSYGKSFLASQRSGAISRMADLGLTARIRNRQNVTYNVLKAGREFLDRNR